MFKLIQITSHRGLLYALREDGQVMAYDADRELWEMVSTPYTDRTQGEDITERFASIERRLLWLFNCLGKEPQS